MSSTSIIELATYPNAAEAEANASKQANFDDSLERRGDGFLGEGVVLEHGIEESQRWNKPRINIYRLGAAFWGFVIMGANDAAVGALIPYLEPYYSLNHTIVSLLFLSPFIGYVAAALLNDRVHFYLGQRGVAIICAACHLVAYTIVSIHPPFPVLVVIYILAGLGNGLEDAAWNAWVGNLPRTNEIMGFLHACYGLGATLSPLIATSMITRAKLPWYTFYYLMVGAAAIEMLTSVLAFWKADGRVFRKSLTRPSQKRGPPFKEALFTLPAARTIWLCTAFLFIYMGVEVSIGGWVVTFMMTRRSDHGSASAFASGMTATGFWLGLTVGRVILGFVTPKVGERLSVMIYIPIAMALQLLFWLVPQFYVSAVAVGLQGFFIGPLFPAAVIVATRLLPRQLHVFAIGFAAACGGGGASAFPFAVGAIAQSSAKGVEVLQPIVLALLATLFILWLALPRVEKKDD